MGLKGYPPLPHPPNSGSQYQIIENGVLWLIWCLFGGPWYEQVWEWFRNNCLKMRVSVNVEETGEHQVVCSQNYRLKDAKNIF